MGIEWALTNFYVRATAPCEIDGLEGIDLAGVDSPPTQLVGIAQQPSPDVFITRLQGSHAAL